MDTRPRSADPSDDDLLAALESVANGGELPVEPELRALAETYRDVYGLTSVLEDDVPECTVTLEDIETRLENEAPILRPWALRAAAAAVLVAAAGAAAWWGLRPDPVVHLDVLGATPVASAVSSDVQAAIDAAPVLADFTAVADGEMRWLESLDTARDVAAVSGRPILLFIHHPTCPWCLTLRQETFVQDEVATRLRDYVPVRVDVQELPTELQPFLERGWPYLGALDADGNELVAFPGPSPADALSKGLQDGLDAHGMDGARAWGPLRALASRLAKAQAALDDGRLGDAARQFDALAADDADGRFGSAARHLRDTLAADARRTLVDAVAADDTGAALDAALERFAGTPWQADLEKVRDAFRETGRLPRLEPPIDRPDPVRRR